MKTSPFDKRGLIRIVLMVSLVPDWWALLAAQGARSAAKAWEPFLVIGVFQAVLLILYIVLTMGSSK